MIITCPRCNTKYTAPDQAFSENGKQVRCAGCGHNWFQASANTSAPIAPTKPILEVPAIDLPPAESIAPAKEKSPEPLSVIKRNFSAKKMRLIATCCALIIVILTPLAYRKLLIQESHIASLFSIFGVQNTAGLVLSDVAMEKTIIEDNKTKITIKCAVKNTTKEDHAAPLVKSYLLGKGGKILESFVHVTTTNTIKAEQAIPCEPFALQTQPEDAEKVSMQLSDRFDMILRQP